MSSRAPRKAHPRRVGSSYLLSGLVKVQAPAERASVRPGLQGRAVRLLRLPVPDEAGQRGLRLPPAQRPQVRGDGGGEDSGERAHRVHIREPGQAGGRGDGRHRPGAAPAAGDRRGGAGRREAAGWSVSTTWRRPPTSTSRTSSPASGNTGAAGETCGNGGGGQGAAVPDRRVVLDDVETITAYCQG